MPTPEQWRLYREEIARSRRALPYWLKDSPEYYNKTTEARVAVADHMTALEGLLKEIGSAINGTDFGPFYASEDTWRDWSARIAALLGSDAAESAGR